MELLETAGPYDVPSYGVIMQLTVSPFTAPLYVAPLPEEIPLTTTHMRKLSHHRRYHWLQKQCTQVCLQRMR